MLPGYSHTGPKKGDETFTTSIFTHSGIHLNSHPYVRKAPLFVAMQYRKRFVKQSLMVSWDRRYKSWIMKFIISSPLRVGAWTKPFETCASLPPRFGVIQSNTKNVSPPLRKPPWKIDMEPTITQKERGKLSEPNASLIMCKMLIFRSGAFLNPKKWCYEIEYFELPGFKRDFGCFFGMYFFHVKLWGPIMIY